MKFTPARSIIRWMVMVVPALLIGALVAGLTGGLAPVSAQTCSWAGTWTITSSGVIQAGTETWSQSGTQVSTNDGAGDQLNATVSGNSLNGLWKHGGDQWAFTATMDPSGTSFKGFIGPYGSSSVNPQTATNRVMKFSHLTPAEAKMDHCPDSNSPRITTRNSCSATFSSPC